MKNNICQKKEKKKGKNDNRWTKSGTRFNKAIIFKSFYIFNCFYTYILIIIKKMKKIRIIIQIHQKKKPVSAITDEDTIHALTKDGFYQQKK